MPAVCAVLEALPDGTDVRALVAVAGWASPPRATTELDDVDVDSTILWDVTGAGTASDDVYVWIAGEAAVVGALRRHLRGDLGLPRGSVALMGYGRQGRSERG